MPTAAEIRAQMEKRMAQEAAGSSADRASRIINRARKEGKKPPETVIDSIKEHRKELDET